MKYLKGKFETGEGSAKIGVPVGDDRDFTFDNYRVIMIEDETDIDCMLRKLNKKYEKWGPK